MPPLTGASQKKRRLRLPPLVNEQVPIWDPFLTGKIVRYSIVTAEDVVSHQMYVVLLRQPEQSHGVPQ